MRGNWSLLIFVHVSAFAQVNIDSLQRVGQDAQAPDSLRLDALYHLSWSGYLNADTDSSLHYAQLQYDLASEVGNRKMMASALNTMGVVMYFRGNSASAIQHYNRALKLREDLKDSVGVAASLANIGMIYRLQKEYGKALEYYERSASLERSVGHRIGEAQSVNSVANIYFDMGDHMNALKSYRKALSISSSEADSMNISIYINNIGLAHLQLKQLDSATYYFRKANAIQVQRNDVRGQVNSLNNLGVAYTESGRTDSAETVIGKAVSLARKHGFMIELRELSNALYKVYRMSGDVAKALNAYEMYISIRDSLSNEEQHREVLRQEYAFAYDKQALADSLAFANREAVLHERDGKQRVWLLFAGVSVLLLVALAFVIYGGKKRSDELLLNILPYETAQELKAKGTSEAKLMESVTVLFTDFKDFTALSEQLSPNELVRDLNKCFSAFDRICEKHGIEKIKTIGDAYMAAGGLPTPNSTHAHDVVKAALEMRDLIANRKEGRDTGDEGNAPRSSLAPRPLSLQVRIGIHTGPVVAGIVGIKKFQYDIWGDTVNTASRMESSGEVGKVNISEATYALVKDEFTCEYRGEVEAKGKGKMGMYFVNDQ